MLLRHHRTSLLFRNVVAAASRHLRFFGGGESRGKIVFSGIQPTGELHLGNYYGAIQKWLELQSDASVEKIYISVVDLHAITVPESIIADVADSNSASGSDSAGIPSVALSSSSLRDRIYSATAGLLAAGLDPSRCVLFQQSRLPQHSELCWILGCLTATMARLNRLAQYKERSAKYSADGNVPLGLFVYPVLQAADILLYRSTHVPVGDDQQQHLMIARHLAEVFNRRYSVGRRQQTTPVFPIPERISTGFARVRSLRDPARKMSKSDADPRSRLNLNDDPDVVREKFKKALTDMDSRVTYDSQGRPAVANLIQIHSMVSGESIERIVRSSNAAGLTTAQYKLMVADCVVEKFEEYRERYRRYMRDKSYLDTVLRQGAEKAAVEANETLKTVRLLIGLD